MPTFPIQVKQSDHLNGMDIDVDTSVTLFANGRVVVNTTTHEETALKGGHAGVVVLLYDAMPLLQASYPAYTLYAVDEISN
jgi:hypothetical protein